MTNIFSEYGYQDPIGLKTINQQKGELEVCTDCSGLFQNKGVVCNGDVSKATEGFQTIAKQKKLLGFEDDTTIMFGEGVVINTEQSTPKYLTFTANTNNSSVGFRYWVEYVEPPIFDMQYRLGDSEEWTTYTVMDESNVVMIDLNEGESVQFKGVNPKGFNDADATFGMYCMMGGSISASGDITSIVNGVGGDVALPFASFFGMFDGCTSLTTAPALPAKTLAENCYASMFYGCTSLTTAPALPAETLAAYCYNGMFNVCTSLTTAPALPAETLAEGCYARMFSGCTGLTTAPALPAETLAENCYARMFSGCTLLTTAPELPATMLTDNCYYGMFSECTSLNSITCLATNISASDCTVEWVYDVAQNGTFTKASGVNDWTTGDNGIPDGWTVQEAQF
ncbi:MAG: leucine-rich repeat protein [Bacteroidales bacterium]|nr:leucine-rich repeat protein [Bacteroidales bacterium]